MNKVEINEALVTKLIATIRPGLCSGVGSGAKGDMCVMHAIQQTLGEGKGDQPSCVGEAVRRFDIKLNDAKWSSNEARAKGMMREAIAKLGSNQIDQVEFSKRLVLKVIQRLLPEMQERVFPDRFVAEAKECREAKTLKMGRAAAQKFRNAAADAAADSAADSAAADAASDAYVAVIAAVIAAADSAADSAAYAATYAAADSAAYAAAYAAASDAYAADAYADFFLFLASNLGCEVLIEMKSPGAEWLWLVDKDEKVVG